MAAEWTYFLNKQPLYVGVALGARSHTRELLTGAGEFAVTLCAEEQAELADFAGSFSLLDVDKTTSDLVEFGAPEAGSTPWVEGGLLGLECVVRQVVDLPVHRLFVGEVLAVHPAALTRRPLVKHGTMATLGPPVQRSAVVAAAKVEGGALHVFATGPTPPDGSGGWQVSVLPAGGEEVDLGVHPSAEYGDFEAVLPVPEGLDLSGARVRVERSGAKPGFARLP